MDKEHKFKLRLEIQIKKLFRKPYPLFVATKDIVLPYSPTIGLCLRPESMFCTVKTIILCPDSNFTWLYVDPIINYLEEQAVKESENMRAKLWEVTQVAIIYLTNPQVCRNV